MSSVNDTLEVLHSTNSNRDFEITTREALTTYPAVVARPLLANKPFAWDITPNGDPVEDMKAWLDICDADIKDVPPNTTANVGCLRLATRSDRHQIGDVAYGEAPSKPVELLYAGLGIGYWDDGRLFIGAGGLSSTYGLAMATTGRIFQTVDNASCHVMNRKNGDGDLVVFQREGSTKGSISVAGSTVSYNSFFGAHWTQMEECLPGTVVESTGELCEFDGEYILPKCKVSDTPKSKSVYGVYFSKDDDGDVLVGSLGAYKIRVRGHVEIGDYLESSGDGTATVQDDDVLRASTIAKVTSTARIDEYEDGSFTVPCTLHCG